MQEHIRRITKSSERNYLRYLVHGILFLVIKHSPGHRQKVIFKFNLHQFFQHNIKGLLIFLQINELSQRTFNTLKVVQNCAYMCQLLFFCFLLLLFLVTWYRIQHMRTDYIVFNALKFSMLQKIVNSVKFSALIVQWNVSLHRIAVAPELQFCLSLQQCWESSNFVYLILGRPQYNNVL